MKRILFILILLFGFNLFSYEYLIYENLNSTISTYARYQFYTDENGYLQIKRENVSGDIIYQNKTNSWYNIFNNIRLGQSNYINLNTFKDYYTTDILFLNDLYLQSLNMFLNLLYNSNNFGSTNYIEYNDYQILYNADGLAVESIVGGVWAGLYDDNEKYQSGDLYDNLGRLQYYNGEPATPVDSFYVWLACFTHRIVGEVFQELSRTMIFGTILCIVLVLAMLYFCMENFLFVRPRRRFRPYYLYGEDGSRHTFRQVELEGKNYARLNPEWARRRREENERARDGR